ncbi:hypothetical protein [Pseudomonas aeruginosa]|uniref:hypothetical protein n=1 Tax=Pseudomonas aeruginosa TaxID=287 RepID=UPI0015F0669A|nr:hypothetical protein [Pseudomonas aeruginosa]MBA5002658.1 hypothetical protein [Pseudomonas aeruginosa]
MALSIILVAFGMAGFVASCVFGVRLGSKMLELLHASDPILHSKLQVGSGAQFLVSPSSLESQRFILRAEYKNHPHASVRALGFKVHVASYAAVVFAAVTLVGFIVHAVVR